jgi:hypothetical protein
MDRAIDASIDTPDPEQPLPAAPGVLVSGLAQVPWSADLVQNFSAEAWLVFTTFWDQALAARGFRSLSFDAEQRTHWVTRTSDAEMIGLNLDSITHILARLPRGRWPAIITLQVEMAEESLGQPQGGTLDLSQLRLRLRSSDEARLTPVRHLAAELDCVLVEDRPQTLLFHDLAEVAAELKLEPAALEATALANLRAAVEPIELQAVEESSVPLFYLAVAQEQANYGAAALLCLGPTELAVIGADLERGVLVALPSPDVCVLAPLPAPGEASVFEQLTIMARLIRWKYRKSAHPLYAHLLWWHLDPEHQEIMDVLPVVGGEPLGDSEAAIVAISAPFADHFGLVDQPARLGPHNVLPGTGSAGRPN